MHESNRNSKTRFGLVFILIVIFIFVARWYWNEIVVGPRPLFSEGLGTNDMTRTPKWYPAGTITDVNGNKVFYDAKHSLLVIVSADAHDEAFYTVYGFSDANKERFADLRVYEDSTSGDIFEISCRDSTIVLVDINTVAAFNASKELSIDIDEFRTNARTKSAYSLIEAYLDDVQIDFLPSSVVGSKN